MRRERALKIMLAVVGVLFCASSYPMVVFSQKDPALAMMMSVYTTLGVFLLLAARRPSEHRSLIGFTAWSSLAHASLMTYQAFRHYIRGQELIGVALFALIGVLLLALAPAKREQHRVSAAAA
jgi:hypothetical protein